MGVYYPFHFVEKNNPEHTRKNCMKGLTCCTQGRRIFYCPHSICFRGLHRKKIVLRWNDTPFAPIWDQIEREWTKWLAGSVYDSK